MIISYGTKETNIDVTMKCLMSLNNNNIISIPSGDHNRAFYFTDPLFGIKKFIYILNGEELNEYNDECSIEINTIDNTIITTININLKLQNLHSKLKLNYGTFNDELPEQKMSVRYLTGKEKVLEIGGNIGRNSLIIASILERNNFVTLESDPVIAKQLEENRDINNLNFHVESSALSNRQLIQRGWDTFPSDTLIAGYNLVNTITLIDLKRKYNIIFDTLVLDCEGAFYYILMDMPEILDGINLIIMENDYHDISNKNYIDEILTNNNFYRDYVESGGWGPCYNNFFEVWKK